MALMGPWAGASMASGARAAVATDSRASRAGGFDAVRPLHHAVRLWRRGRDAGGRPRPPPGASRPGRAARLRRGVDGRAPLRPLRARRPPQSDPGGRRPGRADEPHPDRPDGEHRALVASHPAGRGPRAPGQPHPGPGRRGLRPRDLALRGAAVPSARRSAEGCREPRALSRDRRDRAEGLDRGALRPPGPELHVSRRPIRGSRIPAIRRIPPGRTATACSSCASRRSPTSGPIRRSG